MGGYEKHKPGLPDSEIVSTGTFQEQQFSPPQEAGDEEPSAGETDICRGLRRTRHIV